jgi:hypothetical protein
VTVTKGQKFAAAGRVVMRQAGENRVLRAAFSAAETTLGSFGRVFRVLFHEVTAFFFVIFAVIGAFAFVREYRAWVAGKVGPGKVVIAILFTLMFGWFGVSSFWKAKK